MHPSRLVRTVLQAVLSVAAAATLALFAGAAAAQSAPQHLRIVGGLGAVNQYLRHEEPFWTKEFPRLSAGKTTAEIVPFDRAGIRGQEMLRLVQVGAVPFGTSLLNQSALQDPEVGAPDLAGLNPDMASLRRSIAAFRPYLERMLRERYGIELLAVYAYPAQALFCNVPVATLNDLSGRRIRVSSATQSDWVTALGAIPVQTAFAEVVSSIKRGNIDCAITGTMSGNTIGLHEVTTHLHAMPINWGVAAFIANGGVWASLPKDIQELLRRELPKLEQAIWAEAEKETAEGIACNTGAAGCVSGRKGGMTLVAAGATDAKRRREILSSSVLPAYLKRCGPACSDVLKRALAGVAEAGMP